MDHCRSQPYVPNHSLSTLISYQCEVVSGVKLIWKAELSCSYQPRSIKPWVYILENWRRAERKLLSISLWLRRGKSIGVLPFHPPFGQTWPNHLGYAKTSLWGLRFNNILRRWQGIILRNINQYKDSNTAEIALRWSYHFWLLVLYAKFLGESRVSVWAYVRTEATWLNMLSKDNDSGLYPSLRS